MKCEREGGEGVEKKYFRSRNQNPQRKLKTEINMLQIIQTLKINVTLAMRNLD
jgi:hypothetical protein